MFDDDCLLLISMIYLLRAELIHWEANPLRVREPPPRGQVIDLSRKKRVLESSTRWLTHYECELRQMIRTAKNHTLK